MPQHVRLWEIDGTKGPQDLPQTRLDLESRLEDWLERDISMIAPDSTSFGPGLTASERHDTTSSRFDTTKDVVSR